MSSGPSTFGIMIDVELVADLGDGGGEVVEAPRRVERVDPGPQLGVAEVDVLGRPRPGRPGPPPCRRPARRPRGWRSSTSTVGAMSGTLATIFGFDGGKKWIIRDGRTGISRTGAGAPTASGRKKSLGLRIAGEPTSPRKRRPRCRRAPAGGSGGLEAGGEATDGRVELGGDIGREHGGQASELGGECLGRGEQIESPARPARRRPAPRPPRCGARSRRRRR